MQYMNEMSKIKERVLPYLKGKGVDIGCFDCKIMPDSFGIDGRKAKGVDFVTDDLYNVHEAVVLYLFESWEQDYVFSSHCLEHLIDDYAALEEWSKFLKVGGYLILYLPDSRRYTDETNMEHMRLYTYDNFLFWFTRVFCGEGKDFTGKNLTPIFELIESGEDPHEEDMYSFYIVARKL